MRFVLIGKPHVHHERISVVGALDPIGARHRFSFMDLKAILENYQVTALPASHRLGCSADMFAMRCWPCRFLEMALL
jgi:hypothetical protein